MYTATAIIMETGKTIVCEHEDKFAAIYNASTDLQPYTDKTVAHGSLAKAVPGKAVWYDGIYVKVDYTP